MDSGSAGHTDRGGDSGMFHRCPGGKAVFVKIKLKVEKETARTVKKNAAGTERQHSFLVL